MSTKAVYSIEKNGYRLIVLEHKNGIKDMTIVADDYDMVEICIKDALDSYELIRQNKYSEIEFQIQTQSRGSQSVGGMKKFIEEYQRAIETVEFFEQELLRLENEVNQEDEDEETVVIQTKYNMIRVHEDSVMWFDDYDDLCEDWLNTGLYGADQRDPKNKIQEDKDKDEYYDFRTNRWFALAH